MDATMLVIWIALATLGYLVVIIGLAGLPMRARGRTRRIKWSAWVTMLAVGFVAAALGFGWFLAVAVGFTWATLALLGWARSNKTDEPDADLLLAETQPGMQTAISNASNEQLCDLWVQTSQEIRRIYLPSARCAYAELRQAILDELSQRDPDGVSRWLGDRPDRSDLRTYLHHHQS